MEEEEQNSPLPDNNVSSEDATSESETELMVKSRARRTTAGNRYSTLVAQKEAEADDEDEVAMLFAEAEGEDEDFNSDEGDEDADMSSSDDDDQGPNVAADDLEGEKTIEKEAKAERAKKRKADLALTTVASLRKKPRIDPTALRRAPAPKPSKRKERVSWLPGSDAAPGRTSLRKQTILHRAETHAKLRENEEQRLKLKARREKREREREAEAPKEMTQADRLAEAERVERRNAKSLNKWEAMEKKRAEEQAARLAALKERKLEGAVVTWYSSRGKYIGLKDSKDSEDAPPLEAKKRGRKPKALLEQLAAAKLASSGTQVTDPVTTRLIESNQPSKESDPQSTASAIDSQPQNQISNSETVQGMSVAVTQDMEGDNKGSQAPSEVGSTKERVDPFLTGIHEYASMDGDTKSKNDTITKSPTLSKELMQVDDDGTVESVTAETESKPKKETNDRLEEEVEPLRASTERLTIDVKMTEPAQTKIQESSEEDLLKARSTQATATLTDVVMSDTSVMILQSGEATTNKQADPQPANHQGDIGLMAPTVTEQLQPQPSPISTGEEPKSTTTSSVEPPVEVISTRNLVILDKFDELSEQSRLEFGMFNKGKSAKPVKHSQELCPITGLLAKYRDPHTGIAYANPAAYKMLQELKAHQLVWSSMLGCYVGQSTTVARGVPEGFLGT